MKLGKFEFKNMDGKLAIETWISPGKLVHELVNRPVCIGHNFINGTKVVKGYA